MIIDSSALVAIVLKEPGWEALVEKLHESDTVGIGTPTLAETAIVLTAKLGMNVEPMLSRMLQEFAATPIPFGERHWKASLLAYERFGKGRHEASLNFGDCMCYATAKLARQPLLFVGRDFARTDIEAA